MSGNIPGPSKALEIQVPCVVFFGGYASLCGNPAMVPNQVQDSQCHGLYAGIMCLWLWPTHSESYGEKSNNDAEGTLNEFTSFSPIFYFILGSLFRPVYLSNFDPASSSLSVKLSTSSL
ncbi:hypothetical protein N7513_007887 [Penicillium frequentans]|nr:hypothetical protein N7513_007887 [Penicillium glabrum]